MLVGLIDLVYSTVAVPLARATAWFLGLFSDTWRRWHVEQQQWQTSVGELPPGTRIWFHAASMGEFEQAMPIIDRLQRRIPDLVVVVSITSLSGINHARRMPNVDCAFLLPLDRRSTMRRLVRSIQPSVCVIDRYDLWRNMIVELDRACVPIVLVNATVPSSATLPVLHHWVADSYRRLSSVTSVTDHDAERLHRMEPSLSVAVLPDTRVDRVRDRLAATPDHFEYLRTSRPVVVIGSSWPADERLWGEVYTTGLRQRLQLFVVPHQFTPESIAQSCTLFSAVPLSAVVGPCEDPIVVDRMGILVELYRVATAAFVGGGFGAGVHSTTEPAALGIPIASGPGISRSSDARSLEVRGILTTVSTAAELHAWVHNAVLNDQRRAAISLLAAEWLQERSGSADQYAEKVHSSIAIERP